MSRGSTARADAVLLDRAQCAALLLLSFTSGAADAFAFLRLDRVFTANMTGNLILAGMFDRPDYVPSLLGSVVAVGSWVAALVVVLRVTASPAERPGTRVLQLLACSVVLQAAAATTWLLTDGVSPGSRLTATGLAAGAFALQTSAALIVSGRYRITTTFVTGVLTSLVNDIVEKRPGGRFVRFGSLAGLTVGAAAGTLVLQLSSAAGAVLPVVSVIVASALLMPMWRRDRRWSTSPDGSSEGTSDPHAGNA